MSVATQPFSSWELTRLLDKARKKNALLGVTGMLLYSEGAFLQAIEGEAETVDNLFATIERDERHSCCEILIRRFVGQRDFANWSMGFAGANFVELRSLPGFSDLLINPLPEMKFQSEPTVAHRLLLGFRDGLWRQPVANSSV